MSENSDYTLKSIVLETDKLKALSALDTLLSNPNYQPNSTDFECFMILVITNVPAAKRMLEDQRFCTTFAANRDHPSLKGMLVNLTALRRYALIDAIKTVIWPDLRSEEPPPALSGSRYVRTMVLAFAASKTWRRKAREATIHDALAPHIPIKDLTLEINRFLFG